MAIIVEAPKIGPENTSGGGGTQTARTEAYTTHGAYRLRWRMLWDGSYPRQSRIAVYVWGGSTAGWVEVAEVDPALHYQEIKGSTYADGAEGYRRWQRIADGLAWVAGNILD